MNPPTVTFVGARGGHGTTTVATALAILASENRPTRLVSADATALLGIPADGGAPSGVRVTEYLTVASPGSPASAEPEFTIVDAGALPSIDDDGDPPFVVLRGPCYLGLRHLVTQAHRPPAGIVLLAEPGRSLTRRDVEDVVGAPVVATIGQHAAVARTLDAGLLLARLHRLPQFRELCALAGRLVAVPEASDSRAVA